MSKSMPCNPPTLASPLLALPNAPTRVGCPFAVEIPNCIAIGLHYHYSLTPLFPGKCSAALQ